MPYEITATRKRPQSFEEFKGQEFVSATLEASLDNGRIAHAYLFSGPRGCGKTSAARILAKSLNCEKGPTKRPCGVCRSCVEIARGASLDVLEIDGASNTSVDNVRQIKDEVLFPPNGGKYKVYIIDEVHMLSNSAFNALLKTIEEPPPYIVFIFATTELHKVPATIKSRCQQFAFKLFGVDLIKALLAAAASELGVQAEDEALLWIAKEAGGSMRDAYTLFDQVVSFSEGRLSARLIRDKLGLVGLDALNGLFLSCSKGDSASALDALDAILARGVTVEQCVIDSVEYFRSLLFLKHGIAASSVLGAPREAYEAAVLEAFGAEQIERALGAFLELYRNLRLSVEPRFELELAVAKLCRLVDFIAPSEIAKTIAALKRSIAGGTRTPSSGSSATDGAQRADAEARGGGEKKKPELPSPLTDAFGSLAAAAAEEAQAPMAASIAKNPSRAPTSASPSLSDQEAEDEVDETPWSPSQLADAATKSAEQASTRSVLPEAEALRAAVIEALGRSSPLLKTGLSTSLPWRLEQSKLVIPFRSGIEESVVRPSLTDIASKASEVAGRTLKIELVTERRTQPSGAAALETGAGPTGSDPVTAVERVFRGSRVEPR